MSFQGKLTTKLKKLSVDDAVVELNSSVDRDQLNTIVKSLLIQKDVIDKTKLDKLALEFIVGGRLLQLSIAKHLDLYSEDIDASEVLSEKLVEIEYTLSYEAPEPLEAISHNDWVSCVDANELYMISGSYDNSISIYSVSTRKCLITITNAHQKAITKVKIINTTHAKKNELYFVSTGHDEICVLRCFNASTQKSDVLLVYKGHSRSVNCVDINDDLVATGSYDKTVRLWSSNLSEDITTKEGDHVEGDETSNESYRKKKFKAKSVDKCVVKNERRAILTMTGHQESVTGAKWLGEGSNSNDLATCSMDGTICIWDVEVGESKRKVLSAKPLLGLDYSSEKNLLISASCDRHIRTWDARSPDNATAQSAYTSHYAWVSSVAFGRKATNFFISGGYDNLVKLWDLRSPKASLYDLIGHHDKVLDVNWSNPDFILSGSADSTLKVFSSGRINEF